MTQDVPGALEEEFDKVSWPSSFVTTPKEAEDGAWIQIAHHYSQITSTNSNELRRLVQSSNRRARESPRGSLRGDGVQDHEGEDGRHGEDERGGGEDGHADPGAMADAMSDRIPERPQLSLNLEQDLIISVADLVMLANTGGFLLPPSSHSAHSSSSTPNSFSSSLTRSTSASNPHSAASASSSPRHRSQHRRHKSASHHSQHRHHPVGPHPSQHPSVSRHRKRSRPATTTNTPPPLHHPLLHPFRFEDASGGKGKARIITASSMSIPSTSQDLPVGLASLSLPHTSQVRTPREIHLSPTLQPAKSTESLPPPHLNQPSHSRTRPHPLPLSGRVSVVVAALAASALRAPTSRPSSRAGSRGSLRYRHRLPNRPPLPPGWEEGDPPPPYWRTIGSLPGSRTTRDHDPDTPIPISSSSHPASVPALTPPHEDVVWGRARGASRRSHRHHRRTRPLVTTATITTAATQEGRGERRHPRTHKRSSYRGTPPHESSSASRPKGKDGKEEVPAMEALSAWAFLLLGALMVGAGVGSLFKSRSLHPSSSISPPSSPATTTTTATHFIRSPLAGMMHSAFGAPGAHVAVY
ncbi:hypothetical protein BJ684DRAFT_15826 [Piptocephalis cylindrospora]|uniref:Uncharacterized protein n=1 Tax=Piptocephalis cylindrospora TaxID=1907219 RepID=A0A4P9Y4G6_9FUNG|nr:hypothetical protein BJ684DRAFT_15826 [Piptocephalis cylindrospora]|eukprot:RKP13805.1 hypothetical protein BJ684DRAFT_15826 [Piptocephalis cylindrospora]